MKKGFAPILIVGLILASAILGLVYYKVIINPPPQQFRDMVIVPSNTPNPSPIEKANWVTYTNAEYGFSIDYPLDFSVVDHSSQFPSLTIFFYDSKRSISAEGGGTTNPFFYISASLYQKSALEYISDPGNNLRLIETKKVGTNDFLIVHEKVGIGSSPNQYLIKVKGNIIKLSPDINESADSIDYKIFDQVIMSFKPL